MGANVVAIMKVGGKRWNIVNRSSVLAVVVLLSICFVQAGALPDNFETYTNEEYAFSVDLPKGWTKFELERPFSGGFSVECCPDERNKNPDMSVDIWNTNFRSLDDFVEDQIGDKEAIITDCMIAGRNAKKATWQSDGCDFTAFFFFVRSTGIFGRQRYYGRSLFRRDISSFEDKEWNNFVEEISGSLVIL